MGESSEGESEDKSGPGKSYSHFAYPETVIFLNGEIDSAPFVSEGNVKDDMVYCWNDECENAEMEFKYWLESEDWHKSRKIMWKRSFCLYGPPGTGKTSFVRYLGHKYGMPVIAFDLATFDNAMFSGEWAKAINGHSPCIVLIEDIDAVFNGRENVCNKNSMRQMLTFDCLLNCLDGVENNDGLFVVITTNHLEKLDPALLRAGRVDRKIKIGNMAIEQRRQLAKKLINHMDEDSIDGLVEETEGMTAANVSRRFVEVALDNHWRNFDEQILDSVEKTSIKNEEFVTA
jgi:SpoVK/Ycf46/Vps4 family AAA+-type ATPase